MAGTSGDRERLTRELDTLAGLGITNLRVLGASQKTRIRHTVEPSIQRAPGDVDENILKGLDFLLSEMGKRGMKAVIYLNNYWEWSGGMSQYVTWASGGRGIDPYDTTQGWGLFMDFSATFYSNDKANEMFRSYIRTLVNRQNTENGRRYADDPTIMAWQLANEPRPGRDDDNGRRNLGAFNAWIRGTSAFIHSIDTNHLVSTGSEGYIGTLAKERYFLDAHRARGVDYLTLHLWPKNWQWYDPLQPDSTYPEAGRKSTEYIARHVALAESLGKPIVMEEFGMSRDNQRTYPGESSRMRDMFYHLVLRQVYDSASAGKPIAGANFWAWGGEGKAKPLEEFWKEGDPLVGDPPMEPQGYNSVFNADRSTISVLSWYAHLFSLLRTNDVRTLRKDVP
jgi:mannan endo-1,4-beta-mannosidase